MTALVFDRVTRVYPTAGSAIGRPVLFDVSFTLDPGAIVSIVGRSGSGKSTLLHLAAGIDVPTSGTVRLGGRALTDLTDAERAAVRRSEVGLVFQFFHLVPHLPVLENVALPAMIAGDTWKAAAARAAELLQLVGLLERRGEPVANLSGGEMQRVAICRALLRSPRILLADEPTGNLDDSTARVVMDLMLRLCREQGASLLYVTHDRELAARADATWELHSGRLDTT